MSKHTNLELTALEADELHALLVAVITNGDQWDGYDLRALARVDSKLAFAIRGDR